MISPFHLAWPDSIQNLKSILMDKHIINILMVSDDECDFRNLETEFRQNKVINPLSLVFQASDSPEIIKDKIVANMSTATPTVILLDISLPDMNGLKILKSLMEEQKVTNTRIFIVTSSSEVKEEIEKARFNIAGYIEKPVSFPKFASAISQLKSSWQYYEAN